MARQLEIKQPFDLELSLTMGQALRWRELPPDFYGDGHKWFSGVLGENLVHIRQTEDGVEYRVGGVTGERPAGHKDDRLMLGYFREDTDDIAVIYDDLSRRDGIIAGVVERHKGLRLLRQDPWECTVTYVLSARALVERMTANVEAIAQLSQRTARLAGDERHIFPLPKQLVQFGEERLRDLGLIGLPAFPSRINAVANRIDSGFLDLNALKSSHYRDTEHELRKCDGIGPKIADCIALFSLDKLDAFPVDTHIKQALAAWNDCPAGSYKATANWARGHFGPYAGYAGQFLFRDQRTGKSGAPASRTLRQRQDELVGESHSEGKPYRYLNRSFPCPECGAEVGRSCRYPSGYHYAKGHSARGPRK